MNNLYGYGLAFSVLALSFLPHFLFRTGRVVFAVTVGGFGVALRLCWDSSYCME